MGAVNYNIKKSNLKKLLAYLSKTKKVTEKSKK